MTKKLLVLMVALLAIVGTRAAQLPPMHKTAETASWRLTLQSAGASKITVITLVKEHLGLGMKEAKDLVDSAPCVLLENSYYEPAKAFYDDLVDAGATATLIDTDPEVAYTPPTYIGVPTYNVVLEDAGSSKVSVITVVKNTLGIGLKEAKDLVESAPCTLLYNVDYETAAALFDALAELGATVQMVPVGEADPADPSGTWMTTVWNATSNASLAGVLRDELGLTLSDAYALISSIPAVVLCGVSYEESIALTKAINNSGYGKAFTMRLEDGNLPSPSDVVPSDVTINSANISWTAGGTETKWIVRYGLPEEGGESDGTTTTLVWDFEDPELEFDGWTSIDADGDGNDWFYNHEQVHTPHCNPYSGEGVVCSASYDNDKSSALTPDNWLVSPKLTLGGVLKFWAKGQDTSYCSEHFAVFVSTSGNTSPSSFVQVSEEFTTESEYKEYTVDLSSYSGEGYVAIRHFNVTDQFILDVDYITYEFAAASLPGNSDKWKYKLNVTNNPYTLSDLQPAKNYVVQVMAVNGDCNNVSGWSSPVFVTTNSMLPPYDFYVFNVKQDRASLAWEPGCGETKWHLRYWKDKEPEETFESGELNDDWKVYDANADGYTWEVLGSGYSYLAHTGNCSLIANDGQADEWVVLPAQYLNRIMTFWAWGYGSTVSNRGKLEVYVSTDRDDLSSFVKVSPTWDWPLEYQQFVVDLPELLDTDELRDQYLGQYGYIALRAYGSNGGNWLVIDDIAYLSGHFNGEYWEDDWVDEYNLTDNGWHNLTDLDLNTDYNVKVRGQLGGGVYTPWSDIVRFKTWSDLVFISDGNWNDPDCWFNEEVPPADADVIIAAECDIPAGYIAEAKGIKVDDGLGLLTIKEGGQLKYRPDDGQRVWVGIERTFKANQYYYLRMPQQFYFPDEMLEGSYTLEYFDQIYGWRSISAENLLYYLSNGNQKYYCYRYRRTTDLTVDLRGTPPHSGIGMRTDISIELGSPFEGWNLVGNTYPCDAWLSYSDDYDAKRQYWVMDDDGNFQPASGPLAPLQAVFVKVEGPTDESVHYNVDEPKYDYPVSVTKDIAVNTWSTSAEATWPANGGEMMWNLRYRESDNGTYDYVDFESGPYDWTYIDGDGDGSGWNKERNTNAHDGWYLLYSLAKEGTDNWFLSPKLELGGIFSFWARCPYSNYDEHVTVYVSTNNFDTDNFQQASQDFLVDHYDWRKYTVDLSDISASGMGYIAIRHHDSEKGTYLYIDDISYMTYPESGYVEAGEWNTVEEIAAQGYTILGLKPSTRYDLQVQGIFEGDDRIGDWSQTVQFTTKEGSTTGVVEYDADQSRPDATYDLQGRRVNSKPQQGIYIRKGHKFVVK